MVDVMIRLFESTATSFNTNGLGVLPDAILCTVTEERNGEYELEMDYPITGKRYSELELRRIIVAKPNPYSDPQPFRIYFISKPINGIVTINAEHISYDLSGYPVSQFSGYSASESLSKMEKACEIPCPFLFSTDKTTSGRLYVPKPMSIRSILGGTEGSILDVYGGEYEFDNYSVKLWNNRGSNRGVSIRYGKNLIDLRQEENCNNLYTGVMPFWYSEEEGLLQPTEKIVNASGTYDFTRIYVLDLSSEFSEKPTRTELIKKTQEYIEKNNIGVPKVSLEVSFVELAQSEEYKNYALLERVYLCDTVNVEFPKLNVSATAKCIKTVYNILTNKYDSVELGDAKSDLASTISLQSQNIIKKVNKTKTFLENAIDNATQLISGGLGGHVVIQSSTGAGYPDEILIMDTDNINTATKVWRWNKGGLGYSSTGYNGPYATAITADGQIVANFVKAGELDGTIIKAGTILGDMLDIEYRNSVKKYISDESETALTIANEYTDSKLTDYWTSEAVQSAIKNAQDSVNLYVRSTKDLIMKKNYIVNGEEEIINLNSFSFDGSCATATIVDFLNVRCIKVEFVESGTFKIIQSVGIFNGELEITTDIAYPEDKEPTQLYYQYGGWWMKVTLPDKPDEFVTSRRNKEFADTRTEEVIIGIRGEIGDICYITNIRFLREVQEVLNDLEAKIDVEIEKINLSVTDIYDTMKQNIIMDGDFKDANIETYWQLTNGDDISRTTFLSKRCAKISSASCALRQYMKVQKSGTYTLKFKVAGSSSSAVINYNIHGNNFSFSPLSSSEWQTVIKDINLPAGEVFSIYFTSAVSGTIVYITDVEFIGYVGSGYSQSYIRILKDSITSQVAKISDLESNVSTIKQTADNISTEVKKKVGNNEVISKINQSAESVTINANKINLTGSAVQVAFNKWSDTMNFRNVSMDGETTAAMSIYSSSGNLKMRLHSKGAQYYNTNGERIGLIGTQEFNGTGRYSLEFKLRNNGSYMTWYDEANNIMAWTYTKNTVGGFTANHLHAQVDLDMHGFQIYNSSFASTSDERLKTNIVKSDVSALDVISKLEMKSFDWIEGWTEDEKHVDLGLIANQVLEVCPDMVIDSGQWLNLNMNVIIMYLVKAVQELVEFTHNNVAIMSNEAFSSEYNTYVDDKYTLSEKIQILQQYKNSLTLIRDSIYEEAEEFVIEEPKEKIVEEE